MSKEPSEPEAAAQCLWTLAFDPSNSIQARLEKHVSTLEDVFKSCDSEDMKKAVNGILRTLESTKEPSSQVGIGKYGFLSSFLSDLPDFGCLTPNIVMVIVVKA